MRIQIQQVCFALIVLLLQNINTNLANAQIPLKGATFFSGEDWDYEDQAFLHKLTEFKVQSLRWQLLPKGRSLIQGLDPRTPEGYAEWIDHMIQDIKGHLDLIYPIDDDPNTPQIGMVINMHVAPLMDPDAWGNSNQDDSMHNLFVGGPQGLIAREAFYSAWEAIANAFKNEPRVIAYDLLNEPKLPPDNQVRVSHSRLMQEVARRIRTVEKNSNSKNKTLIICVQDGNPKYFDRMIPIKKNGGLDPNVVYDFHFYAV